MRGISAILVMIMLVLIIISIVGLFYTFSSVMLSSTTTSATESTSRTTESMMGQMRIVSSDENTIFIRNTGITNLSNFTVMVNGIPANFNMTPSVIPAEGIGNLKIYDIVKDGDDIEIITLQGASVKMQGENNCRDAVVCYNFDEGFGTKAYDSSENNKTATINGATWYDNGLSFNGIYDNVYTTMSKNYFTTSELTITVRFRSNATDNMYGMNYQCKDYDGAVGEDYVDSPYTVRRALVSSHNAGYLSDGMAIPAGTNGPFSLTFLSKTTDITNSNDLWTIEVWEDGSPKWSYTIKGNQYTVQNSYTYHESPSWYFDGTKNYVMKLYWHDTGDLYADHIYVMARRGGIADNKFNMFFEKHVGSPTNSQIALYTLRSDNTWSYTYFHSSYPIFDGNWHTISVTLKDGVKNLYVDGSLKQSESGTGDLKDTFGTLYMGNTRRTFYGEVDEIRIYNRSIY